jgi:hypothetical protein
VVAKVIPNIKDKMLAYFLYKEIFINYRVFKELLLDNNINLLSYIIELYIKILKVKHCIITLNYPRTNSKNKNINSLLGKILIKYLIGKLTYL